MRVAATDLRYLPHARQGRRSPVPGVEHLPVVRLEQRKIALKPIKIFSFARPGEAGKNVVDAEK
ncbi:MAG: hypothetical protein KGL59_10500 [Acidobacteriota bacterium]|nr:hypothetical protein [Acidobacteriota bacterium]